MPHSPGEWYCDIADARIIDRLMTADVARGYLAVVAELPTADELFAAMDGG